MNMDRLGHRFGLIVFDECHHLPGPTYGLSAISAIAPFRLGLTATPERADNAHTHLDQLIGPIVFRREITELRGQFLADYRVMTLYVSLSEEERDRYERARELYRGFVQQAGIDMRKPDGWSRFLYVAFRSPEGREAFHAYREQRILALAAPAKLNLLARLLDRHSGDRVIIFTHDNATVYTIARQFLVPVITHQTKTKERREVLLRFNCGNLPDRRHVQGAERGRERPRGQRRDHPLGLRLRPRARPAAGPDPPQVGRQGGRPLRGHHPRHRRGVHLQPPPPAQRVRRELRPCRCRNLAQPPHITGVDTRAGAPWTTWRPWRTIGSGRGADVGKSPAHLAP